MILHTPSKDILWFKLKKENYFQRNYFQRSRFYLLLFSKFLNAFFGQFCTEKCVENGRYLYHFFAVNPYFKTRSTFIALSRCAKKEANSESTVARIRIFYDTSQFSWKNMLGRMMPGCIELQIRVKPEFNSWASDRNSLKTI